MTQEMDIYLASIFVLLVTWFNHYVIGYILGLLNVVTYLEEIKGVMSIIVTFGVGYLTYLKIKKEKKS
jgi:uncharacterized protein YebE (UPF0316 family)